MRKISVLEKAGSSDILITLFHHQEKMYVTELKKTIGKGSMSTFNMRLLELINENLLNDEHENKFGGRRYIWLTNKGKKIASHLESIEKILHTN